MKRFSHDKEVVPRLGLTFRITLFIIAIVFTTSLVFNIIFKERYEKDWRELVEAEVVSVARLRAADWAKYLHENMCRNIQEEMRVDVAALREINDIRVFDSRGKLVACRDGQINKAWSSEWIRGAIAAGAPVRSWDGYTFRYFEPVTHSMGMLLPLPGEDDTIGFLSVEYDAGHLRDHLARTRNFFLGITVILTFLFTLTGFLFSRRLIKPISDLTKASQRISKGDLSVTVQAGSGDEVGVLAENFNAMARHLGEEIEEREAAEKEVRFAKERLESFINNTSDAVGIIDTEGTVLQVNSAFKRIYGWPASEIIGTKIPIVPDDRIPEFDALIEKVRAGDSVTAFETKRKRRDGSTFDASLTLSAIRDERGNVIAFAGITRDITERKRMIEELERSKEQLRSLTEHLHSAREEERMRISREIHDELGQTLTALKIDLSWVNSRFEDKSLTEKTALMLSLLDSTIKTVKRLCSELRPSVLDDLGLTAAIEWQAGEFQNRTGINCQISVEPENITLDHERSTTVFRIFQEALTNVVRHADATSVRVELREEGSIIRLIVQDNGRGIRDEELFKPQSFGLIGMRERARSFGGEVKITGMESKGTSVTVTIPAGRQDTFDTRPDRA